MIPTPVRNYIRTVRFNKNKADCGQIILSLALIIILSVNAECQLHCINYTSQDGLPTDDVTCAASDQDGFIWFGTGSGVCKFDGIQFQDISSTGTGNIPGGVFTNAIVIDENNDIWIGTEGKGIYHFDTQSKQRTNYSTDISSTTLIPADKLFLYDPISSEFSPYDKLNKQLKSSVRDLLIDGHSNIWFVLGNNTIVKYSIEKITTKEYLIQGYEGQVYIPVAFQTFH